MASIVEITEFNSPLLDVYARLTGRELRSSTECERGIFIAESPTVIEVALDAGCEPISLLTERRLINSDVRRIFERVGDVPIYVAERELLRGITGFDLTRGALCAMKRPMLPTPEELLEGSRRVAIFEGICDSTNIGALFRSAAAMGIDAVLLTSNCCDPLSRRAVRCSMGTVFQVPFAWLSGGENWVDTELGRLRSFGFKTAAMALTDNSVSISHPDLASSDRLAIVLGTEGTGLRRETISACDYTVKIPMTHGVDSLNVAAAGAVAFWELCMKNK